MQWLSVSVALLRNHSMNQRWNWVSRSRVTDLAGLGRVTDQCVRPGVWPGFEFWHARLSWHCFYRVTPSRQTNIRGFSSVTVTALLVYLFQLVPVIFTYSRADCPCDVTTFLDLMSIRLLTGSGRVTGRKSWPGSIFAMKLSKSKKLSP